MKQSKEKLKSWVLGGRFCGDGGGVLSWIDPENTGYEYAEATGFYLLTLTAISRCENDPEIMERAERASVFLQKEIRYKKALGKRGRGYLFDSAICYAALCLFYEHTRIPVDKSLLSFLKDTICSMVRNNHALTDVSAFDPNHWSDNYGSHIIKALALCVYADNGMSDVLDSVDKHILPHYFNKVSFRGSPHGEDIYFHCNAYAIEGLLFLQEHFGRDYSKIIASSLLWLAENQNQDGSFYNWLVSDEKKKVCDATVQAVRLWCFFDKARFQSNIEKGLEFVLKHQDREGGIYYSPQVAHINSWTSLFFLQTLYLMERGNDILWLL